LRGMIGFGIPLVLSNLAFYTLNFSDRFFLQHFRSLEEVGLYAVGYKFAFMISYLLIQPFNIMWQTRMYLLHAKPRQGEVFDQIFVLYSVVLTYAALALSMLSPETVRLMAGPKFQAAQAVIPVVSLAYVFCGIGFFMQTGMFLAAKTKAIGLVAAAAAIVNLVLNYFLIGHFGMMGAAWATLISFAAIAGGNYLVSQRAFHLSLSQGRVMGGIGIGITLYLASRWLGGSGAVALSIKGASLVSFPWLLWKLRLVSPAEIGTLASAREMLARMLRPAALATEKAAGNG